MAGKRRFDEAAVLDRAAEVFRARGYDGASLDHLTAATGLKRGSLYNAFGSKAGLFEAAFRRYSATREEAVLAHLDTPDLRAGIAALFGALAEAAAQGPAPCLIARSLGDCAAEVAARAAFARHAETAARIRRRLDRAEAEGEIAPGTDTAALAATLAGLMRALSLIGRPGGQAGTAPAVARAALALLPARP